MSERMVIDIDWLERDWGTAAERAAFGALRIAVGDAVFTEVYDVQAKTVREWIRVSLLHLGRWLAENWWRLRWEPECHDPDWRMSHELAAAGGGFIWPPLRVSSDGEVISLRSGAVRFDGEPIRYLRSFEVSVPAHEFERAVDELMECVLARLDACEKPSEELADVWAEVSRERSDEGLTQLRKYEAMLGLDPDAVPRSEIDALVASGGWMGKEALSEVLRAARFERFASMEKSLAGWRCNSASVLDVSEVLKLRTLSDGLVSASERSWERGAKLAAFLRRDLGLGVEPVDSDLISNLMGGDIISHSQSIDGPISAGFRSASNPKKLRAVLTKHHPTSRRFEAGRLLADILLAPDDDSVLPITSARTARQKVQRSFTQEFLCPSDGLREQLDLPWPDQSQLTAVAQYYDVSEWTVISTAVNRELVSRDYLDLMRA